MSPTLTQSHSHTDNGMEVPAQFERIIAENSTWTNNAIHVHVCSHIW